MLAQPEYLLAMSASRCASPSSTTRTTSVTCCGTSTRSREQAIAIITRYYPLEHFREGTVRLTTVARDHAGRNQA